MYKFTPLLKKSYAEIGQENPLRWEILYRDAEDSFVSQSGLIKCKDFFNEIVRKYNTGADSSIYGFNTEGIQLNEEGMYFRMYSTTPRFEENIERVINTSRDCDKHVTTEKVDGAVLLFIPRYYWNNTYLLSLVSYYIRCCNCAVELESIDDLWTKTKDVAIHNQGKALALKWGLAVPEEYQQYWYFCNSETNSVKEPSPYATAVVHNNGVMSWSNGVK